jgi:hypothetical protein
MQPRADVFLALKTLVAGLPSRACIFCFHYCLWQLNSHSRAQYCSHLGAENAHISVQYMPYLASWHHRRCNMINAVPSRSWFIRTVESWLKVQYSFTEYRVCHTKFPWLYVPRHDRPTSFMCLFCEPENGPAEMVWQPWIPNMTM